MSSLPEPTIGSPAQGPQHPARNQAAVNVRIASDSDRPAWNKFVDDTPAGTFFHRYAWSDVLRESFGYAPQFLIAEQSEAIVGLLPLVHKTSVLFGDALISLPFCSYGGPLGVSSSVTNLLAEQAFELAQELKADYVELRGTPPADNQWSSFDTKYATFEREIAPDPDAILASIARKGRKHAVRQSLRAGLSFEATDNLTDFYRVISASYRNLGTPIFSKRYFDNLRRHFPNDFQVFVVRKGRQPLATSLAFTYRDHIHPLYAGGTAKARALNANDFLYFNMMCNAREQGLARFDFGRSKAGTGSFAYKKHWGYEPRFLTYGQRLAHGKELPDLSPMNPRYKAFIAAWKRLPLGVSRLLGPQIVRHLG